MALSILHSCGSAKDPDSDSAQAISKCLAAAESCMARAYRDRSVCPTFLLRSAHILRRLSVRCSETRSRLIRDVFGACIKVPPESVAHDLWLREPTHGLGLPGCAAGIVLPLLAGADAVTPYWDELWMLPRLAAERCRTSRL
jgi:hypothetical protein